MPPPPPLGPPLEVRVAVVQLEPQPASAGVFVVAKEEKEDPRYADDLAPMPVIDIGMTKSIQGVKG